MSIFQVRSLRARRISNWIAADSRHEGRSATDQSAGGPVWVDTVEKVAAEVAKSLNLPF